MGILVPAQSGSTWTTSPSTPFLIAWVTLGLVVSMTADSFAGERERHTLETLLASRLSEKAILFGKAAAIVYGWSAALLTAVLGLVTVNLMNAHSSFLCYSFLTGVRIIGLSVLLASMMTGIGTLVSLRAPAVRSVQQILMFCSIALFIVPAFIVSHLPGGWQADISRALNPNDPNAALTTIIVFAIMLLLNLGLFFLALIRFQRAQLLLE